MQSVNITSEEKHKLSKQATILIIDDEKAMQDSCCQVLSNTNLTRSAYLLTNSPAVVHRHRLLDFKDCLKRH